MKRNTFQQTSDDRTINQIEDQISDDTRFDDALSKASAEYYKQHWRSRIKDRQESFWVAVGLYLFLFSAAFAVL